MDRLGGMVAGGAAAAGLTIHAARFDIVLTHTVCLAGAFTLREPISGGRATDDLSAHGGRSPFTLLHGVADDVIPVEVSRTFASRLQDIGWPIRVIELPADHGSIAAADYDPAASRYWPTQDPEKRVVAAVVASHIAIALGIDNDAEHAWENPNKSGEPVEGPG